MPRQVRVSEVQASLLVLLDDVAAGETIEIVKDGRAVARLIPAKGRHSLKGKFAGVAVTAVDEEDLFTTGAW